MINCRHNQAYTRIRSSPSEPDYQNRAGRLPIIIPTSTGSFRRVVGVHQVMTFPIIGPYQECMDQMAAILVVLLFTNGMSNGSNGQCLKNISGHGKMCDEISLFFRFRSGIIWNDVERCFGLSLGKLDITIQPPILCFSATVTGRELGGMRHLLVGPSRGDSPNRLIGLPVCSLSFKECGIDLNQS